MSQENVSISGFVASAARSTDHYSRWLTNEDQTRVHAIITVTDSSGSTATFTPKIQGKVPSSTKGYDLLVGTAISSTGITVLKVGPGVAASTGGAAQDMIPSQIRFASTHVGTEKLTYSVDLQLGV